MFKKFKNWKKETCWISAKDENIRMTNGNQLWMVIHSIIGYVTVLSAIGGLILWVTYKLKAFKEKIDEFKNYYKKEEKESE